MQAMFSLCGQVAAVEYAINEVEPTLPVRCSQACKSATFYLGLCVAVDEGGGYLAL